MFYSETNKRDSWYWTLISGKNVHVPVSSSNAVVSAESHVMPTLDWTIICIPVSPDNLQCLPAVKYASDESISR